MKRLFALPALVALALPAFAQDPSPAAPAAPKLDPLLQQLVDNLPKLQNMKWEGTHTLTVNSPDMGVTGTIGLTWQDMKHFKVNLDIKATPGQEALAAGAEAQDIKASLFADGTHLWVMSPMVGQMMGGMEGIKVELAVIESMIPMAMSQMGGMAPNPQNLGDMLAGLTAKSGMTLKEEGSTAALKRLVFQGDGWKGDAQFDAKTWFPMSMTMGSEAEKANVNFKTTAFSVKESFPEDTFTAKGIDATKVMDMTGMIQAQLGGLGGGGGDEDLEF